MTVFCSHWLTITAILYLHDAGQCCAPAGTWSLGPTASALGLMMGSKDFIPVLDCSCGVVKICTSLHGYSRQSQTDQNRWCKAMFPCSPDLIHMRAGLPRAHLWKAQTISYVCQFCYAMANPRQWTVGPLEDFGPSGDPHEVGLFVQTFSAVPSWRSFCCAHPVPPCTKEQKLLLPSSLGIFSVPLNL